jgi:hypothetical protein
MRIRDVCWDDKRPASELFDVAPGSIQTIRTASDKTNTRSFVLCECSRCCAANSRRGTCNYYHSRSCIVHTLSTRVLAASESLGAFNDLGRKSNVFNVGEQKGRVPKENTAARISFFRENTDGINSIVTAFATGLDVGRSRIAGA